MLLIGDQDIQDDQDYRVISGELKLQFIKLASGRSRNLYRTRIEGKGGILDIMGGIDDEERIGAVKQYFFGRSIDFLISLFSTETSEVLAIFPGKKVTRIRTAAASALAADILSRKDSRVLGCIGAGYQAYEQIRAVSQIRPIEKVVVADTDPSKLKFFSTGLKGKIDADIFAESEVNHKFKEADILITATTSSTPVIAEEFIGTDCYINSIGSYTPQMREIDRSTICGSTVVAVDSIEETTRSAGEIIDALSCGCIKIEEVNQFTDLVMGNVKKRKGAPREGSYFKSIGVGIEDLAVAKYLYSYVKG